MRKSNEQNCPKVKQFDVCFQNFCFLQKIVQNSNLFKLAK